jgi:hypothetical protein
MEHFYLHGRFETGCIETGRFANGRYVNRTLCKPDVLKPDVFKPDVKKPEVLWVYPFETHNTELSHMCFISITSKNGRQKIIKSQVNKLFFLLPTASSFLITSLSGWGGGDAHGRGGDAQGGGGGMHVHPVHPPWVRHWLDPNTIATNFQK